MNRLDSIIPLPVRQELKALTYLALPVIGAKLASMAIRITDTVMAGNIGTRDLAAVAVGNGYSGTLIVFVMGILLAVNPIIGQLYGANRVTEIGQKFRQGLWLSLFLGILAVIGLCQVSRLMVGLQGDLAPIAHAYLKAICWGTPFCLAFHLLRIFNGAMGNTKPALYIIIASIPINILGNFLLMYGCWGLPKLGARGLGYASSFTWIFMFVAMLVWTLRHKPYARLSLWRWTWPRWSVLGEMLGLGVPTGLSIGFEAGLYSVTMVLIGGFGSEMVASHAIAISIATTMYMIPAGVATAISIRVSHAVGRGDDNGVRLVGRTGILLAGTIMAFCSLLMACFPGTLISFYTHDAGLAEKTMELLVLATLFQMSDGLQVCASGALRGIKDTRVPMWANAIAFWGIGLPLGAYLGLSANMGARGFWIGLLVGLTLAAILHNLRFYLLTRKAVAKAPFFGLGRQQLTV